jgi:Putative transposase
MSVRSYPTSCTPPAVSLRGGWLEQAGDGAYLAAHIRDPSGAKWLADRQAELLPVPYFHVVFTLPAPVGEIAFQNEAAVYAILFRAAAETLATIAADPRHLGAQLGMTMVLHTWGQTLQHHPHVHCVVPGGGPSLDGTCWVPCFFLPVRILSRLFRRLFLQELESAFGAGKLQFFTNLADLAESRAFARRLRELRRLDWVVYAKPPFGGPDQALAYLGRYTHRVAIANSRLLSLADGKIRFTWKDYRADGKTKVMTLDAAARSAGRLPSHPPLRFPRQWLPR